MRAARILFATAAGFAACTPAPAAVSPSPAGSTSAPVGVASAAASATGVPSANAPSANGAPSDAATSGSDKKRRPAVEVLYRGRTPDDLVRLAARKTLVGTFPLGIERARDRAWITHDISGGGKNAFDLVQVPLSQVPLSETAPESVPVDRWLASPKSAPYLTSGSFYPLTGTLEDDLARYARIVESTGARPGRPSVAVSQRHILYEDGDHLTLRDRDGRNPRYFSKGVQSAYAPALSPDGKTAAFYGCDGAIAGRGRTLPEIQSCYALYVAPLAGKPVRIAEVAESSPPFFEESGRFVYAASTLRSKQDPKKRDGGCFYRVDVAPPHAPTKLFCASSDNDALTFRLAPDGKTAVVGATVEKPDLAMRYTWLSLPEGTILGATTIPLASSGGASLGSSGLLVTPAGGGVVVADKTGAIRPVPGLEKAFVMLTSSWDGDRVYALRTEEPDLEEVLRIDARAVVGLQ